MSGNFWARIGTVLVVGYLLMGRSFAYLGMPRWNVFIGEIALATFLLAAPKTRCGTWLSVVRRAPQFAGLVRAFLVFLAYGILEVLHGFFQGYSPLTSLRDLAFNYYAIFLLLGLWAGVQNSIVGPRFFRLLAWVNGIYGVAYLLFLNKINWFYPGVSQDVTDVPVLGSPEFSFVVLLALIALEPSLVRVWHLLVLNAFVILGMQVRGEWLALFVGLVAWGILTKNIMRMVAAAGIVVLLLALMYAIDFRMPGPESRGGGEISARDLIGRALAPADPDLAARYSSTSEMASDTVVWRLVWWLAIWQEVHQSWRTAVFGLGYGFPLADLVPSLRGEALETPHNAFFYALGYTGWIGVFLLAWFQIEILKLLWKKYKGTGQPVGLVLWFGMLAYAQFTAYFEAPYGAIPFYLLIGAILGFGLRVTARVSHSPSRSPNEGRLAVDPGLNPLPEGGGI